MIYRLKSMRRGLSFLLVPLLFLVAAGAWYLLDPGFKAGPQLTASSVTLPQNAFERRVRDYLIANPSTAAAYSAQKQRCVALHPTDRIAYGDCKSDWIKRTEALALKGCTDDDSD